MRRISKQITWDDSTDRLCCVGAPTQALVSERAGYPRFTAQPVRDGARAPPVTLRHSTTAANPKRSSSTLLLWCLPSAWSGTCTRQHLQYAAIAQGWTTKVGTERRRDPELCKQTGCATRPLAFAEPCSPSLCPSCTQSRPVRQTGALAAQELPCWLPAARSADAVVQVFSMNGNVMPSLIRSRNSS